MQITFILIAFKSDVDVTLSVCMDVHMDGCMCGCHLDYLTLIEMNCTTKTAPAFN